MPTRKAPAASAKEFAIGTRRKGADSKSWEVYKTTSGVKRWKRCTPKKKKGGAEAKEKKTRAAKPKAPKEVKEKKDGERKDMQMSRNIMTKEEWKDLEDQAPLLRKLRLDIRHKMKRCGQTFIIVANKQVGDTWNSDYMQWEGAEFFKTPWMLGELQLDSKKKKIMNPVIRIVHGLTPEQQTCVFDILKRELGDSVAWDDAGKALLVNVMGNKAK